MPQGDLIKFHRSNHQNDLDVLEGLIYPIFSKKNKKNKQHWKEIRSLLLSSMKCAKVNKFKRTIFWFYVNRTITKGLKKGKPFIEVEHILRKFIRKYVDHEKDRKINAIKRAKRSFEKVKDYIVGDRILDLGAGDGFLSLEIKEQLGKEVVLIDIVDYNYTDLPLILYNPDGEIPLADEGVDTTILYTVLHHADNPEYLLKEAVRVTKHRLVILEAYAEDDDIRVTNSFFDWFYNRVIGDEDINVPLNFRNLDGWEKILKKYGFEVIESKYIGLDEPIVPEYKVIIIAKHAN